LDWYKPEFDSRAHIAILFIFPEIRSIISEVEIEEKVSENRAVCAFASFSFCRKSHNQI
jgi:hypothetical protein